MARVIAVTNQKGGVAKTTSTLHVGVALSELGFRVLLVDLDPQGSLTLSCGFEPDALPKSVYNALIKGVAANEVVLPTASGPKLIPANIDLSMAEMQLVNMVARERRLSSIITPIRDEYDFVLIDCQPSLGLLTVNALAIADEVLVPVACEYLALRGVKVLMRMVGRIRVQVNSKLAITGIIPTMFDGRTSHSKEVLEEIRTFFAGKERVFSAVVNRSVRFAEAASAGQPVFSFAKDVPGAAAYREIAKEIAGVQAMPA